jgi:hypothetical protein
MHENISTKRNLPPKRYKPLSSSYNVGIPHSTIILQSPQKCRAKDYSRFKSESQRGKTTHEKSTGNKMVRKVLLVYLFRGISCSWVPPDSLHRHPHRFPPFTAVGLIVVRGIYSRVSYWCVSIFERGMYTFIPIYRIHVLL